MSNINQHLMIIAGETSGDTHAAHLVDEISKINSKITFSGLGGEKMKSSGVELYEDLTRFATIGFTAYLKHYGEFKRIFRFIVEKAIEIKPDAVILVDYPGFNLPLAQELKKNNIKVIYYISPQVWAWKEKRIKIIRESVDKMMVLFDFEKEFYAKHDTDVDFVGHPLVDTISPSKAQEETLRHLGLSTQELTIGILPGSRVKEIDGMLPPMLEAAQILTKDNPRIQYLLFKAPSIERSQIDRYLNNTKLNVKVIDSDIIDGMNACHLCMVTSGTATLETAILNKPMVVVYKTSFLTWLLAKIYIKIPYIGLVNVVAGEKIVPECIQYKATGKNIAQELKSIFTNEVRIAEIKSELRKVNKSLGTHGASQRAAQEILKAL